MDDKTRGVGDQPEDLSGWSAETTRNLDTAGTYPSAPATSSRRPARTTSRTSGTRGSGDAPLDRETDIRTRELQAEIADTREDMAETIEAIQDRLRPGNIVSNATERVKNATTDKVRHVAESAGDTAHDLMDRTRSGAADIVEGARQNPMPALMIGAGVAWLLMDRSRKGDGYARASQRTWSSYRTPRYGADELTPRYRANHVAAGTAVDLSEANYSDVDYRQSGTGSARGTMGDMSSRAGEMADDARYALRRTTRNAQNGLQRLLRDNPLLVGAAAVLVGAAVGAALPETERENELLGETRDSVVNQAKDAAREAASTVQEVATDAANTVTERLTDKS